MYNCLRFRYLVIILLFFSLIFFLFFPFWFIDRPIWINCRFLHIIYLTCCQFAIKLKTGRTIFRNSSTNPIYYITITIYNLFVIMVYWVLNAWIWEKIISPQINIWIRNIRETFLDIIFIINIARFFPTRIHFGNFEVRNIVFHIEFKLATFVRLWIYLNGYFILRPFNAR